jgi:hypothetical protein
MDKAMAKANALLETIDCPDPDDYDNDCVANIKKRKLDTLAAKATTDNLTTKETLAITLSAVSFAFGH